MSYPATPSVPAGLDTPIAILTPRQLFEMQAQWLKEQAPHPQTNANDADRNGCERWYVNNMEELADILGTSVCTLYRMKREGLLDDAISQYGRWMCIDVNKVLDVFRLSNRRCRRKLLKK